MKNQAPSAKQNLALLRFEVICHIKSLRQEGIPLAECLREASSRPWPPDGGNYYSVRTIETWWYHHAKSGYSGLAGVATRADSGHSRTIGAETGAWILGQIRDHPRVPLLVLHRHWKTLRDDIPSVSSVHRFLKANGHDRRSLRAGRLDSGPQKAFEASAPNDLWMVDFACGPMLRDTSGKALATHLCVIIDDHSRLITHAAYYQAADTTAFLASLVPYRPIHERSEQIEREYSDRFVRAKTKVFCHSKSHENH